MTTDVNTEFEVPAQDREAELRAKAAAVVAQEDDDALLKRFIAEARAKKEKELRALAADEAGDGEGTGDSDAQGFPREYVKLLIYKGQQATDEQYVKLGANGYAWKIRRGEDVIVPTVVVSVLNDAVQELTTQTNNGLETRPAHRYPFQVKGSATAEEHRAFVALQRQSDRPQVSHV